MYMYMYMYMYICTTHHAVEEKRDPKDRRTEAELKRPARRGSRPEPALRCLHSFGLIPATSAPGLGPP